MAMEKKQKVAVIGAGYGGLMAVKSCLEEGLEPICFEQHDQIGGVWYYTPSIRPNQGGASYKNLIANTSKEMMCLSDYPFPENAPQFLPCTSIQQYLVDVAKRFDLYKYIHFNTTVTKVTPAPDLKKYGKWRIDIKKNGSSDVTSHVVDCVVMCTGGFQKARMPDIPGLDSFTGEFLHMMDYRDLQIFNNKTVVIMGNKFSAADTCGDAGKLAKQVYWSHGDGAWILSRFGPGGIPGEFVYTRSFHKKTSQKCVGEMMKKLVCNNLLNHIQYGIGHKKDPTVGGPILVSEDLVSLLNSGLVLPKPYVKRVVGREVHFTDGSKVEADMILAATGYLQDFSIVDCPEIQGNMTKDMKLYKWTFPISDGPATLGMIGPQFLVGAIPTAMELQSRWIARVFAKKCELPPLHKMIQFRNEEIEYFDRVCDGKVQKYQVPFQEELAEEIGVKPSYWKLLWETWDLALLRAVFNGPVFSVHYRLQGPGSYAGAREDCKKALYRAYNTPVFRPPYKLTEEDEQNGKIWWKVSLLGVAVIATAILLKCNMFTTRH